MSIDPAYPSPRLPLVPVLSVHSLGRGPTALPSVLDVDNVVPVARGSAAIFLALREAGVDPTWEILVPSYHCLSMIEPIRALGAKPVYVRVKEDLSLDLVDAEKQFRRSTRAVLAAHYFGFYQNMQDVRTFCDTHELLLIEDCAHAFFGRLGGRPVGRWGDYAIASARKFFPIADGGFLVSDRRSLSAVRPSPSGWMHEVKALTDILEEAFQFSRLPSVRLVMWLPLLLKRWVWSLVKGARATIANSGELSPGVTDGYEYVDVHWLDKKMSAVSQWTLRRVSTARIAEIRRRNYARLVDGLSDLPGGRPLWPKLPGEVVPYMFPFCVDKPEVLFPALKKAGMPIYRWEKLATDGCRIANRYARALLQFPCHQELTERELTWMIDCVTGVLRGMADPRGGYAGVSREV